MNIIKKITITAAIAITVISCNDVLDMPSDGRLTLPEIFADFDLARGYVNKCYSYMPEGDSIKDYSMSYDGTLLASFCDEAEDVRNSVSGNVQNWYLGNVSASSFPMADYWDLYYRGIRTCNIFLKEIKTSPLNDITKYSGEIRDWKAQVYMLRAFYFWQIVKRYGPAPIIREAGDDISDYSRYERNSFSACVDSVVIDCERAINYGLMWNIGLGQPGDRGRMTRAVAYAVESQAALYAASKLWNTGGDEQAMWQKAARITGKALNECLANDYKLYTDAPSGEALASSGSAYQSYFFSKLDLTRTIDKETILECKNQLAVWRDAALPTNSSSIRAGACPTQEMADAYEMADGTLPFVLDADGCVIYDGVNPRVNAASSYDPMDPYTGRDPRMAASLYYNGAFFNLTDPSSALQIYQGGNCQISSTDIKYTRTGYYLRKFNNNRSDINNQADGYMKIFRLAELYLNFAEAANEAYGPNVNVPGVDGSVTTALAAVNAVRDRAVMPRFNASGTPSQTEFRTRYRNERRVELAFEQHRFYDVRRWMILEKTDKNITGMNVTKNDDDTFDYTNARFAVDTRKSNDAKFLKLPLSPAEVRKMEKYTGANWQNPGW